MAALGTVQPSSKREGFATIPDVSWSDIGALQDIREELAFTIVEPIRNPHMFQQMGLLGAAGVLMYGPPGCGKTLLAKAVARESSANFIAVKGTPGCWVSVTVGGACTNQRAHEPLQYVITDCSCSHQLFEVNAVRCVVALKALLAPC